MRVLRVNRFRIATIAVPGLILVLFFCLTSAAQAYDGLPPYQIVDDGTGGECNVIGTWDTFSSTCTLTTNVTVSGVTAITISSDGVTLDGGGHSLTGNNASSIYGVYLANRTGVTIRDLSVEEFFIGISLKNSSNNNIISKNTTSNNYIGIDLGDSSNNTLSGNTSMHNNYGIDFTDSNNNMLFGNLADSNNNNYGIYIYRSDGNTLAGNTSSNNYTGIMIHNSSDNNTLSGNTSSNNNTGIRINSSSNNTVYRNNLISNATQASVTGSGSGNIFNLPAPDGGNYWSDFDTPAEGCDDTGGDGFCDAAYVFSGGQDNLPHTQQVVGERSDLTLAKDPTGDPDGTPDGVYWADYNDFDQRRLSVDYLITNNGGGAAFAVEVTGSTASNYLVSLITATPVYLGTLGGGGGHAGLTLKYHAPEGVSSFMATVNAEALDGCGNIHEYPEP